MSAEICLVMGQINPVVGDVAGNVNKIIAATAQARDEFNADLVVFPELVLTGYPAEDLLLRPDLIKRVEQGLACLKAHIKDVAIVVGHPSGTVGEAIYNTASFIAEGQCLQSYFKHCLPNGGVFDEKRYFVEGNKPCIVDYKGLRFGITICEDLWFTEPARQAVNAGAEIIVSLNASPFSQGKSQLRVDHVKQRVIETGVPIVYVNQVGGQDELVFDGSSFALSASGEKVASAPSWQEGLFPVFINRNDKDILSITGELAVEQTELALVYQALVCGLKDYVEKNHFASVVIGLSGGIDSALALALAVDALGADRVKTVMMPSRYTAQMGLDDAQEMADILGVEHRIIPIDLLFEQFVDSLSEQFSGKPADTTEENIQARVRGILLMAISNKTGALVLSAGNKSEVAVGYSTLYGDMVGGFAPIKDVYKTLVYELSNYRNSLSDIVIPQRIITRPPSAELAPNQLDQDSLPPYNILDPLLEHYIEHDWSFEELVAAGDDAEMVKRVLKLVDRSEYKRRQAAPGTRITHRAFGRDRRYPITSSYDVTLATKTTK